MPNYTYTDDQDHVSIAFHGMLEDPQIICAACGLDMWRKPSHVAGVSWGGLSPSQGEYAPDIQDFLDTRDESREAFEERHEDHEKRTEDEYTS